MSTIKNPTPVTVTFRSHHEINAVMAGLQMLECAAELEIEREQAKGEFADDELIAYARTRLLRIVIARKNILGIDIKAVA